MSSQKRNNTSTDTSTEPPSKRRQTDSTISSADMNQEAFDNTVDINILETAYFKAQRDLLIDIRPPSLRSFRRTVNQLFPKNCARL